MADIGTVLFWSLVGSVVSLIGGLALMRLATRRELAIRMALPFGAGALLAAAFLGLLPEAVEGFGIHQTAAWALGGFLAFFVLERLLGWFHHHHHDGNEAENARNKTHATLVIVGDTLHNLIDGIALGAAFLVSIPAGIATAVAVAAHEIPQEIGDFGILLGKGMKPRRVIIVNVLSALATVVGAMTVYLLGNAAAIDPSPLLALAAGFFIYVAAADIIPDIHERPRREGNVQAAMLLLGVGVLASIMMLTPHSHEHETRADTDTHHHER